MPSRDGPYSQVINRTGFATGFHGMFQVLDKPDRLYRVTRRFRVCCASVKRSIGDNNLDCPGVCWVKGGQVSCEVFSCCAKLPVTLISQRGVADKRAKRRVLTCTALEQSYRCTCKGNLNVLHRGNFEGTEDPRDVGPVSNNAGGQLQLALASYRCLGAWLWHRRQHK